MLVIMVALLCTGLICIIHVHFCFVCPSLFFCELFFFWVASRIMYDVACMLGARGCSHKLGMCLAVIHSRPVQELDERER